MTIALRSAGLEVLCGVQGEGLGRWIQKMAGLHTQCLVENLLLYECRMLPWSLHHLLDNKRRANEGSEQKRKKMMMMD